MMTHAVGQMRGMSPSLTARFRECAPSHIEISGSLSNDTGAHTAEGPILPTALWHFIFQDFGWDQRKAEAFSWDARSESFFAFWSSDRFSQIQYLPLFKQLS